MRMDPKYRVTAGLIGGAGAVVLLLQVWLGLQSGSGLGQVIWSMGGFFTILTNLLMAGSFLAIAATGRRLPYGWMGMLTLSMLMVGLVYHLMLAHLFDFSGLRWWTDQAFHTVFPAAMLWFWLMETTRHDPRDGRPLYWLIWPLGYSVYAVLRGVTTGWYPYPFMDMTRLGWAGLAENLSRMLLAFAVLALALHFQGSRMPLRPPDQ